MQVQAAGISCLHRVSDTISDFSAVKFKKAETSELWLPERNLALVLSFCPRCPCLLIDVFEVAFLVSVLFLRLTFIPGRSEIKFAWADFITACV